MPKKKAELSALQVKNLTQPGLHAVGGVAGLALNVSPTGARSWILRTVVAGKRRAIGLGGFPDVTLAQAREKARLARESIEHGIDPVEERRAARAALAEAKRHGLTFREAFERYFGEKKQAELSNPKHAKQWRSTLEAYAFPHFGDEPVSKITVEQVLRALTPIWTEKPETASRVRGRIEAVIDWAIATGHRSTENPARLKGNLAQMLPSTAKLKGAGRHPALSLDQASAWFSALRRREGIAARALEFLALTAARSGEVRGATWEEIDLKTRLWVVPAGRMKAGKEHRVPLPNAALTLLKDLPRFQDISFVFPGARGGSLSDMTLSAVMRRMQADEVDGGRPGFLDPRSKRPAVPHGLRSTFRDWAAERTSYPREMAELALAHDVGSAVERAYRRGDMLEKRREMLEDWAGFLTCC